MTTSYNVAAIITCCLHTFLGSIASTAQLRVDARVLIGSTVKICPNDDYTLIFVCEATGIVCSWIFDPFIETNFPLAINNFKPGEVIRVNSATVYVTEKTTEESVFRYNSQLHISTKVLLDHESVSYQVVCDIDSEDTDEISITKLSKFVFSQTDLITGW